MIYWANVESVTRPQVESAHPERMPTIYMSFTISGGELLDLETKRKVGGFQRVLKVHLQY